MGSLQERLMEVVLVADGTMVNHGELEKVPGEEKEEASSY